MSNVTDEIFYLEKRRVIFNHIQNNPGLHLRKISRSLKIPKTTLEYHIRYLINKQLVKRETDGRHSRYFVNNELGNNDKKNLTLLRNKIDRGIIFILYRYTGVHIDKISEILETPMLTVSRHLKKLREMNLVESYRDKRKVAYTLKNRMYFYNLFIRYENSFSKDPKFNALMIYIENKIANGQEPKKTYKEEEKEVSKLIDLYFEICPIPFRA
jgi:predicted transcriptional regulator